MFCSQLCLHLQLSREAPGEDAETRKPVDDTAKAPGGDVALEASDDDADDDDDDEPLVVLPPAQTKDAG